MHSRVILEVPWWWRRATGGSWSASCRPATLALSAASLASTTGWRTPSTGFPTWSTRLLEHPAEAPCWTNFGLCAASATAAGVCGRSDCIMDERWTFREQARCLLWSSAHERAGPNFWWFNSRHVSFLLGSDMCERKRVQRFERLALWYAFFSESFNAIREHVYQFQVFYCIYESNFRIYRQNGATLFNVLRNLSKFLWANVSFFNNMKLIHCVVIKCDAVKGCMWGNYTCLVLYIYKDGQ